MRLFLAALRLQLRLAPGSPGTLQVWVTAPLFTAVFLSTAEYAGRHDLSAYAVVAPTLMGQWSLALGVAGEVITEERSQGTLEAVIATPGRLSVVVLARIFAVSLLGVTAMAEAWLVAGLGFGRWIAVPHPVVLVLALLANALAMAGTASILSSLFVLMPSARIVQNTLTYPLYLLSGVLVPLSTLPLWVRPVGHAVFLSWSAGLLRSALSAGAVAHPSARVAVVAALGVSGHAVGALLLSRVLRRVRRLGTVNHT
ncbi:ABC transporter permease [Streptomyces sp. TG1A-8]|uniref:ABC transporter permease n=1 Tax=Streptomyces sp. TG1A-8 TaxID=3051385 RepID=UPI00265B8B89|nr:ABC transporter permease [Streptomyces sp. TG1A-8]MDO0925034.1 ABC transporter permease [Streptomyces sp. TG1A-8]